jgi:hypothetical protein
VRQALVKDANLARTAARYRIDAAKIAADVRVERSKNAIKKGNDEPKTQASPKPK